MTRGDFRFLGDSKAPHDLYAAMDTAFSKVEAENPACADSTSRYRAAVSQMAYSEARAMLEAKKYDSAVVLAKRSLVADPKGAAPWNILAEANKQRNDTVGFREALRKVSQAPGTDPITTKAKAQAFYNLAMRRQKADGGAGRVGPQGNASVDAR
jgi:predicted Zn-dependent protease